MLATLLAFGLVLGCGGSTDDDLLDPDDPNNPNNPNYTPPPFAYEGNFIYYEFGTLHPIKDEAAGTIAITGDSSTGFDIKFEDINYTYNERDTLKFTYWIDVETHMACLVAKKPSNRSAEFPAPTAWGIGKGREYFLGHDTHSIYEATEGRIVAGTYDPATKTGTFEVLMRFLKGEEGISFQHNYYAEMPQGTKVGENSKYTMKFTKVENIVEVKKLDLTADSFTVGNLTQPAGSVTAVSITSNVGAVGAITIKYDGGAAIPQDIGQYEVTFDVAESESFNAATGLVAGTLNVIDGATAFANITVAGTVIPTFINAVQGVVEYTGGPGYTFARAVNWEAAYAWFKIDLGSDSLNKFEKVTFNYKGIAGDVGYKTPLLVASSTQAGVGNINDETIGQTAANIVGEIGTSYPATIILNSNKAAPLTGEVFISIFVNGSTTGGTKVEISDINFVLGEPHVPCGKFPCECPCGDCGSFPCECACEDCGMEPCECPTSETFNLADATSVAITTSPNIVGFGGVDGDQDWSIFTSSKSLIIGFTGSNVLEDDESGPNMGGLGGMQIALQHNNDGFGWATYNTPGWTNFSNDGAEIVYFVLPVKELPNYATSSVATGGKIVLNHGIISERFVGAWLTDAAIKIGAGDAECGLGFITRNIE